jgi:hypothetical protein
MAGTSWKKGKYSIIEGETIALLESMKEMEHRGIPHVIFESDSKSVLDAIHNLRNCYSKFSSIICKIKNVLSLNWSNFAVKFIKRQANMVTHTLVRAVISWSSRYTFDLLPLCITSLLNNKMIWVVVCQKKNKHIHTNKTNKCNKWTVGDVEFGIKLDEMIIKNFQINILTLWVTEK